MKELSLRTRTVTPSPIREMFNRSLGMQDVISFTVGEPDFQTPSHIVEAAVAALRDGEHHYTPNAGILPLRKAIGKATAISRGIEYDPAHQIIVTVGGMEALMLAMLTILDPGDEFIISDPCWTNYSRQIYICGAIPVPVSVCAESHFHFLPDDLEKAITPHTKGFVINSPANPTGGIADEKALHALSEIAIRHDLFVISDEVYYQLLYDGEEAGSIATLPGMAERTIIVNSFSKTYAMTGWRVGYALGPTTVIKNMIKLQENVAACVNSAAQFAAVAALEGTKQPLVEMLEQYKKRRQIVLDGFADMPGITCYAPQGTFYAMLDIGSTGMRAQEFADDLLQKARVIVVPGNAFGANSDHYVRISFATSEQTICEGISRIRAYMESWETKQGE